LILAQIGEKQIYFIRGRIQEFLQRGGVVLNIHVNLGGGEEFSTHWG